MARGVFSLREYSNTSTCLDSLCYSIALCCHFYKIPVLRARTNSYLFEHSVFPIKRHSLAMPNADCNICMDPMSEFDEKYPVPCPGNCGFNFCVNCVEHLVGTSKMDYEEASDGSKQMKVKLICPQCRSDLKYAAPDVIKKRRKCMVDVYMQVTDSELTATELRIKYASINCVASNDVGNTKPSPQSPISVADEIAAMAIIIDTDLFNGLTLSMTEEEQRYVSQLMTSCDVDKIAQGVQLLASVSELSRKGITPSVRIMAGGSTATANSNSRNYHHSQQFASVAAYSSRYPSTTTMSKNHLRTGRSNTARIVNKAIAMCETPEEKLHSAAQKRANEHWSQNPLPRRMPMCVNLDICHPLGKTFPMAFTEDEWDGTIADAFCRAHVDKRSLLVTHKKNSSSSSTGSRSSYKHRLWGGKKSSIEQQEDDEVQPREICKSYTGPVQRVIVASAKGQAGKKGIQVGDVITHVNGDIYEGSAADLIRKIEYLAERGDETVSFVFNAELATAVALSKRALDVENIRF